MAKKKLKLSEGVSFLAVPGTLAELRAVAYFRGQKGKLGKGAREVHTRGMESFRASLSDVELRRFNEIMEAVRLQEQMAGDPVIPPVPS